MDLQEQKQAKKLEKSHFVQALLVDGKDEEVPKEEYLIKLQEASKIHLGAS